MISQGSDGNAFTHNSDGYLSSNRYLFLEFFLCFFEGFFEARGPIFPFFHKFLLVLLKLGDLFYNSVRENKGNEPTHFGNLGAKSSSSS